MKNNRMGMFGDFIFVPLFDERALHQQQKIVYVSLALGELIFKR